jgi:hypothetical protein
MLRLESLYKKYKKLIPLLGSWASLIALLYMFYPTQHGFSFIHWLIIILAALLIIVCLYFEIRESKKTIFICEGDKESINQYMFKWIKNSGRIAIFSRDMSFATSNKEIKKLLLSKSEKGEVIACVPKEVPLTDELKTKGAEIYAYSKKQDIVPQTRFTIVNYGQGKKERVAVAHGETGFHVIQEFDKNDPVIYLTKDLINIAQRLAEKG